MLSFQRKPNGNLHHPVIVFKLELVLSEALLREQLLHRVNAVCSENYSSEGNNANDSKNS